MVEQPAPIILTDVQNPTLEIEGDNDAGPENNHFVIGFVLIGFAILCVWTLEEFCCLMGIFSLVGGFISIISGLSRTYNWRKENDITKWTTSEIVSLVLISIIMIPILLLIVVVIMEDVGPFF
jgi:hypothetical protein